MKNTTIQSTILCLLSRRRLGASICPSEVARALWPKSWKGLMSKVREASEAMVGQGELEICQGGKVVDPAAARGPIRLRLPQAGGTEGEKRDE